VQGVHINDLVSEPECGLHKTNVLGYVRDSDSHFKGDCPAGYFREKARINENAVESGVLMQ